ncbi:MAG: cytochrome c [Burkholderiales bacterium]|nr:cytochrome c [Burkholderiales bacterium]
MRLAPLAFSAAVLLPALGTPAHAVDLANGESILKNTCAACHGFPPVGGPERAAGQPSLIANAINFRVPAMGFLRGTITAADIDDIAAYLLFLQNPTPTPTPTLPDSYQGLWLKFPYESESGWGINFTHQGSTLFATWFTYDTDGSGMWLVMSNGTESTGHRFTGDLYRTTAPGAFSSVPFVPIAGSNYTLVGTLSVIFFDADSAEMNYTVNGVTQTKNLARYVYVANPPRCTLGGTPGASPNYQDLWWVPDGRESGWGVNLTHQGDILFGTWFTYQAGGKGMWLVMSGGVKTAEGVYSGVLQRTTGPAFSASPFNPSLVQRSTVGDATFTFTDANNGKFRYTVNGVTQTKDITRLVYANPVTVCK